MGTITKSLGFFLYSVLMAFWLQWEAADLAWSMWFASLSVGGALIFTSIVCNKILQGHEINPIDLASSLGRDIPAAKIEDAKEKADIKPIKVPKIAGIVGAIVFLGFFSVHFGGFHWGHSQFLQSFFPLDGLEKGDGLLKTALICGSLYWPFMLASLSSYWDDFKANIKGYGSLSMIKPYKAVIKNHLIIMALGFMNAFGVEGFSLYLMLGFYFFPYEEIWGEIKKAKKKADADEPPLTIERL